MLHYCAQLILFQALFLGVYELFLKRESFFKLNRIYLLFTPVLAAIIPLIQVDFFQRFIPVESAVTLPALLMTSTNDLTAASQIDKTSVLNLLITHWIWVLYGIGVLIGLGLFVYKYLQLQRLKQSGSRVEMINGMTLIHLPNSREACSFFKTIFLGDKLTGEERKQIFIHECAHVNQKHSWDLLFFEICRVLCWFNPLVYRYQAQLILLHEYMADKQTTRQIHKKTYCQSLLNATFGTQDLAFTNPFFTNSLIKKRLMMLHKPQSTRNKLWKYLLIFPVLALMLTYTSCSKNASKASKHEKQTESVIPPEPSTTIQEDEIAEVPFQAIDQPPVYPGCEQFDDPTAQKNCMSKKIRELVSQNFDQSIIKATGLEGRISIYAQFTVDEHGQVTNIRARSPHQALSDEAKRVVKLLPQMTPGKQAGKTVRAIYTLPIVFKGSEN